jgi:type I site-specific restriction endonuclease
MTKEARARILINALLQRSGWRFFDDENLPANVALEASVKLKKKVLDAFGEDFEKTANGFVDYLLLDERGFPIAVLEAKSEKYDPLVGKEQARKYAHSQNVRFVIRRHPAAQPVFYQGQAQRSALRGLHRRTLEPRRPCRRHRARGYNLPEPERLQGSAANAGEGFPVGRS